MQAWVLCTWTLQEIILLQLWKYNLFPPSLQTALISRRDKRLKKTLVNTSDQSPYLHSFSDEQILTKNTFVKVVLFDDSAQSLWRRWLWTKRGRTDVHCGGWKCFFGTVANVVEGEKVEMTKHIGGLAMSSLYCSSSNQKFSHCREVDRSPGFFFVLLSAFYSGRVT